MNCQECQDRLIEHHHEELEDALATEVATHLTQCGDCALEYCRLDADLKGIQVMLRASPPARLHQKLSAKVALAFPEPQWKRLVRLLSFPVPAYQAALVFAALLVAWVLLGQNPPPAARRAPSTVLENYDSTTITPIDQNIL